MDRERIMRNKTYLAGFGIIALISLGVLMVDSNTELMRKSELKTETPYSSLAYNAEFIKQIGTHELRDGAFTMSAALAINSSGYLFVYDQYDHRIQVFNPSGDFVMKMGEFGFEPGNFYSVEYMLFNESDYLYVSDSGRIQIFDPDMNYHDEITIPTEWGFFGPAGMVFNSTGFLYVTDTSNDSVRVFSPEGTLLRTLGEDTFYDPCAIQINATGYIYILDYWNRTIQIYDPSETYFTQMDVVSSASDMKFNGTGHLYLLDYYLEIYNPDNSLNKSVASDGYYKYFALDDSGNFYSRPSESDVVVKHTMTGEYVMSFGYRSYSEPGQFNIVEDIAVNATGYYYISDGINHRIQIFTPDGQYLSEFGYHGSGSGQIDNPKGLDINSTGYIYVCDYYNSQIDIYDQNGNFINEFGGWGSLNGQFKYPEDVAINDSGYVYVADRDNQRVQYFTPTGEFLGKWTVQSTLSEIYSLDVNSTGHVFVMDEDDVTTNAVNIYTSNGTIIGGFGDKPGITDLKFTLPQGIGLDENSNIYCTDTGNHRIKVYDVMGNLKYKFGQSGIEDYEFQNPSEIMVNSSGYVHVVTNSFYVKIFKLNVYTGPEPPTWSATIPSTSTTGIIDLSWNAPLLADNYSVYRYSEEITNQNLWMAPRIANKIPGTSYQDVWQVEGTWWYAVVAHNETGDSPVSTNQMVTIDLPKAEIPNLNPIDPSTSTTGLIDLSWNDPDTTDNYTVYRYNIEITDLNVASATEIASEIPNPNYQDTWPVEGEWWYAVVAHNETGTSAVSNSQKVIVDLPNATTPILEDIIPNTSTDGKIILNWNLDTLVENYTVLRYTEQITLGNAGFAVILISGLEATSYTDTITVNGTYWYAVIAYNATGSSAVSISKMVSVEIPPDTPSNPSEPSTDSPSTPPFDTKIDGYYTGVMILSITLAILFSKKKRNHQFE
jgi:hypothetical protein